MARKRKTLQEFDYQSEEYWQRLLAEDGLSVERGLDPRLVYVGDSTAVEFIEGAIRTHDGRIQPKKPSD